MKVTGATVHFVNEDPRRRAPSSLQKAVAVQPGDTPEMLQKPGDGAGRMEAAAPGRWTMVVRSDDSQVRTHNERKKFCTHRSEQLRNNAYPGRGIVLGLTPDGTQGRGRLLHHGPQRQQPQPRVCAVATDGIRTEAFDPAKMEDPSLIIYHARAALWETAPSSPTATRPTPIARFMNGNFSRLQL